MNSLILIRRNQTSLADNNLCCSILASIDCNNEQCAKPQKLYEELGCKAFYGARSCCAKRFECPDFKKLDDSKCSFEGKEYKIGETVPRNFTDTTKCVETCFCSRFAFFSHFSLVMRLTLH